MTDIDLTTTYLGFTLAHPVVPSASPITGDIDSLHRLVSAGAPAVVLPSLFEEQVEHDIMAIQAGLEYGAGVFAEAADGYFPELDNYNTGPDEYLGLARRAVTELGVPVIASLNGVSDGGWVRYARTLADTGIHALELNINFMATNPDEGSDRVETRCLELVEAVKRAVDIPVAVKIGPYFSALAAMARRFAEAGADALVMFNRFYQPDIDLETLQINPNLRLSTVDEVRLPLRWIAVLHGTVDLDLAATTGVHSHEEVVKLILAGADVTMTASALLRHGPVALSTMVEGLSTWLSNHGYASVDQAKGSLSRQRAPEPDQYERANYMQTLLTYSADWRSSHSR